jgi:hypothetical protein
LAKTAFTFDAKEIPQFDTEISQKAYLWRKVAELHLGMFIAQQLVWTSLLKRNTWNDLTRQWNVGQKKLS